MTQLLTETKHSTARCHVMTPPRGGGGGGGGRVGERGGGGWMRAPQ